MIFFFFFAFFDCWLCWLLLLLLLSCNSDWCFQRLYAYLLFVYFGCLVALTLFSRLLRGLFFFFFLFDSWYFLYVGYVFHLRARVTLFVKITWLLLLIRDFVISLFWGSFLGVFEWQWRCINDVMRNGAIAIYF